VARRKREQANTPADVVRTCYFCGNKGNPHSPATERPWLISLCHVGLPAICPDCIEAGHGVTEIVAAKEREMEL
jgi:hypothetical protein